MTKTSCIANCKHENFENCIQGFSLPVFDHSISEFNNDIPMQSDITSNDLMLALHTDTM